MGNLLIWLSDHLPHPERWFVFAFGAVLLTGLASPAAAAFVGAVKWGLRGGWAGLVLGYAWGNYSIMSAGSLMTRCRPEQHCDAGYSWVDMVVIDFQAAVGGFIAIWPWQLLWIGASLGCLWGGVSVRRRRLTTTRA
jgi:hypothetical protein